MKGKSSINFTKASIIAFSPPKNGMVTFCDTKEKGLSHITSAGHKSFMVRKRIQGQNK